MLEVFKYLVVLSYIVPIILFNYSRIQFRNYNNAKLHGVENVVRGSKASDTEVTFYNICTVMYNVVIILTVVTAALVLIFADFDNLGKYAMFCLGSYIITTVVYYFIAIKEIIIYNEVIKY